MAGKVRELRRRIRSVNSTKKITKAMELIAASRIVRAEQAARRTRPFAEKIVEVLRDLAATTEELRHPLLERRENGTDTTGLLVLTADRGLAGAFNANVLRTTERVRRQLGEDKTSLYVAGKKGISAYRFRRVATEAQWSGFSDSPGFDHAKEIADRLTADFLDGKIGRAVILYTHFESMLVQHTREFELLPLEPGELAGGRAYPPVYEFEPEPNAILDHLLPMYVEMKLYHVLMESAASEHAARQRAMRAATDNAEELAETLTRVANQARQSEITMEIADIVGGVEALRK